MLYDIEDLSVVLFFFSFPRDPLRCGKWIAAVARERAEEFFKPTQGSVICSKHFLESDVYLTNKGFKRLHKTAVPQIVCEILIRHIFFFYSFIDEYVLLFMFVLFTGEK